MDGRVLTPLEVLVECRII